MSTQAERITRLKNLLVSSYQEDLGLTKVLLWEGCADHLDHRLDDLVNTDPLALSMDARTSLRRLADTWRQKAADVRLTLSPETNHAV